MGIGDHIDQTKTHCSVCGAWYTPSLHSGGKCPACDPVMNDTQRGMKFDGNKMRWSLFPQGVLTEVLKVLEFGAVKYAADNWKIVDNWKERYYNAAMRHLHEQWWSEDEPYDQETGIHHLAHAICCLMFLLWLEMNTQNNKGENNE